MRKDTNVLHEHASGIGRQLGFEVAREVRLGNEANSNYAPVLDVGWFRPLSAPQHSALNVVRASLPCHSHGLLVAGWEIECSDASTRGMQADIANLRVSGAPYGFLAVVGGTRDNLWSRAMKLARAQRHYFGGQGLAVLDARWLESLAAETWSPEFTSETWSSAKGGGGEGSWARAARSELRELGMNAGSP